MSSEKSLTPQIRFKGFTEAWEQRKAIDLFKDVSEKGFDNLPVLSATQDRGMVYRDENGINISHDKKNELTYKHVIPGQFVIHLRSFQGGFAHSSIEGITSPAYTVFRFSNESQHDDIFWKYIFMSERFIKSLETVTYGIRDGRSISYSEFLGLPFAVPEKEEESRVGYFLKKYDSLITLHQRKLDALKKIKSALLEKMFPKDGSNIPEIRFTGFTEAWEQRKLGELYTPASEKNDGSIGRDRIISVANMYFNPVVYVTDDEYLKTYNVMRLGDIAFEGNRSKRYAHGRFVENFIGDGIISHVFKVFRPRLPFDLLYWKYAINNELVMKDVLTKSTKASTMMHELVSQDFLKEGIAVPSCLDEERQIGALFAKLDNLIALHQRKLDALKKIKSALLEKMFV